METWKLVLDTDWRNDGIRAAFDTYTGLTDYLYETDIKNMAEEALTDTYVPPPESLSVVLVLAVVAIGRQVLERQPNHPAEHSESLHVFHEACTRIRPFLLGHNTLLKLQVLWPLCKTLRG